MVIEDGKFYFIKDEFFDIFKEYKLMENKESGNKRPCYFCFKDRKNKDDFFTNRESAILFGIPSNLIEGILVGRKYENNNNILKEIKILLPNCYICNLDGKVIRK